MGKKIDKRQSVRRAVLWSGDLHYGDYDFRCQIWDVSLGGAKVRVDVPLAIGAEVKITLGRYGKFKGHVAWQNDTELGLKFEGDPQVIRDIFGENTIKLGLDHSSGSIKEVVNDQ